MSAAREDLPRWKEMSGDAGDPSARAAELVEAVRGVAPLAPDTLARIKVGVLGRHSPRAVLPLGFRFALLTAVLLASVATAKGTMTLWRRHRAATAAAAAAAAIVPAPATSPRHRVTPSPPPPRAGDPDQLESAPNVVAPPSAPPPPPRRASVPHARRAALATSAAARPAAIDAAPSTSSATATEAQLLARALSRLRQDHDPAGAVSLLDQYARAFPHGVLESEALSARIETAIQMDDRKTALRLLDGRGAFAGRLGSQLLLTRAELRASAGRYAEALGDFDRLLGPPRGAASPSASASASASLSPSSPADLERALYGRAVCLGRMGRDDRARADLADYQRRFPAGKHAAEVARLLKGTRSEGTP